MFYWFALMCWIGVIFWFSSQPNLQSGLERWQDLVLRKIAHMAEYFVLTYLVLQCLPRRIGRVESALALGFALLVAIFDEYHQRFIPGRHGSPVDVGIDTAGSVGLLVLAALSNRRKFGYTHQGGGPSGVGGRLKI